MISFDYTLTDPDGLHARPAGMLVKCAQECGSGISVLKGAKTTDAKKLFSVMGLSVKQGDTITFQVEGKDEKADSEKLKIFCEANI